MLFRQSQRVQKQIKRFLKKEGRVGFQLRELNELLRRGLSISSFAGILQKHHQLLSVFKIFLLIHRVIVEGSQSPEEVIGLLSGLKYVCKGEMQQLLSFKLMQPYRLYLQRRVLVWTWQMGLSSKKEKEVRVYQLLNLINLGTSFADIIYTFGRYYMDTFSCVIDFNIILGADIQGLYEVMVEHVNRPAKRDILDEIEFAHEKMYVVFYNCYFYRYLKPYVPKWVLTDFGMKNKKGRCVTPIKDSSKQTLNQTGSAKFRSFSTAKTKSATSSKTKQNMQDLGESCLFLNQKAQNEIEECPEQDPSCLNFSEGSANGQIQASQFKKREVQKEQQERFKLLLSMQRVINGMHD